MIESRMWSIEWCHFEWPWKTPTPGFKVMPFFDAEYLTIRPSFQWNTNRDLHTTYSTVSFRMTFSDPVTLSDLVKYSVTRSVTRSLCDSWACCCKNHDLFQWLIGWCLVLLGWLVVLVDVYSALAVQIIYIMFVEWRYIYLHWTVH